MIVASMRLFHIMDARVTLSGVGVTKAPFANFSVSKIFDLAKVPVRFPESH